MLEHLLCVAGAAPRAFRDVVRDRELLRVKDPPLPALKGTPPLTARPEVKFNPVRRAKPLQSCPLYAAPWAVAHRAPLSMGFSRQEYWGGLPCPPPGDLPDAGFEPTSLTSPVFTGRFFTTSTTWQTHVQPTLCWAFLFELNWHSQSCSSQLHGWF